MATRGRRAPGAPTDARSVSTDGRMSLTLKIRRFNPEVSEEPWWDEFTVQVDPTDRLVEALHEVKWYHDGTLASGGRARTGSAARTRC